MKTRPLGRTGYHLSEVGFGAWGIGGGLWRGSTDEDARRTLHAALDSGVTFFDTALSYGDGHSERLMAELIASNEGGDRLVVSTKIPPMNYEWPASPTTPITRAFPARHVIDCVEKSLRNLGVEALQVEQFHVWHDIWLESREWAETRGAMERLKRDGKVLHWGVSINDHAPETALRLLEDPLIETAQVIYNVYDRSPERSLLTLARERRIGVIVRVPFDEGALTGGIGPDTVFPDGDFRARYFRGDRPKEAARRADALKELLGEEAATLPELALRFILSRTEVSTVIPGMRRPEHAKANAAVSDGRALSPALLDRLTAHAWDKNWYGA
jgi:aryl-alcohol dehydrogenase-like predicted oxidoreductase